MKWILKKLFWKARLSDTIKMTPWWTYHFTGITFGQYGFGIIWRKRKDETSSESNNIRG